MTQPLPCPKLAVSKCIRKVLLSLKNGLKKMLSPLNSMTPQDEKLYHHLSQFVSDHKREFVNKVLEQRTRYVTVVLENIYQSQNASAVIRTCECMGLQDIHIIENTAKYDI